MHHISVSLKGLPDLTIYVDVSDFRLESKSSLQSKKQGFGPQKKKKKRQYNCLRVKAYPVCKLIYHNTRARFYRYTRTIQQHWNMQIRQEEYHQRSFKNWRYKFKQYATKTKCKIYLWPHSRDPEYNGKLSQPKEDASVQIGRCQWNGSTHLRKQWGPQQVQDSCVYNEAELEIICLLESIPECIMHKQSTHFTRPRPKRKRFTYMAFDTSDCSIFAKLILLCKISFLALYSALIFGW